MKVTWQVADGYRGDQIPRVTEIDDQELADCETEEERENLIDEAVWKDFRQFIYWLEVSRR